MLKTFVFWDKKRFSNDGRWTEGLKKLIETAAGGLKKSVCEKFSTDVECMLKTLVLPFFVILCLYTALQLCLLLSIILFLQENCRGKTAATRLEGGGFQGDVESFQQMLNLC